MILFGSDSMAGTWLTLLCACLVTTVHAGIPLEPVNTTVPAVVKDNPPIKFIGDGWGIAKPGTFGCSGPFDPSISAFGAEVLAMNTSTPGDNATFSFQGKSYLSGRVETYSDFICRLSDLREPLWSCNRLCHHRRHRPRRYRPLSIKL